MNAKLTALHLMLVGALPFSIRAAQEVDRLVPLDLSQGVPVTGYHKMIEQKLFLTPADSARLLVLPSAGGEESVSIYSKTKSPDGDKEYSITLLKAERNIWYQQMYQNMPGTQNDPGASRAPIKIKRIDANFPRDCALAVHRAWLGMLKGVHPPPPPVDTERVVLDGADFEFFGVDRGRKTAGCVPPWVRGKHTSAFRHLGQLLIDFCEATGTQRPHIAEAITNSANQLAAASN
jgi:hypothetical protein